MKTFKQIIIGRYLFDFLTASLYFISRKRKVKIVGNCF